MIYELCRSRSAVVYAPPSMCWNAYKHIVVHESHTMYDLRHLPSRVSSQRTYVMYDTLKRYQSRRILTMIFGYKQH